MQSRVLLFLCAFMTTSSFAVSFDCTKASTTVEKMICTDQLLGRLDDALAHNYKGMLTSNFGGSKADLRKEQLKWLGDRNKCKDSACLVNAYRKRVDETCDYGVVSGVHPECTLSEDVLLQDLQLKKGQEYSDAKATLIRTGWKIDVDYVGELSPNQKKPYGFEEVVCGNGGMAVCSARFLRGDREVMLTLQPKEKLLVDGAWNDK